MYNRTLFFVCMLFIFIATDEVSAWHDWQHDHHKYPTVAVGGEPVIDCQDLVTTSVIRVQRSHQSNP
jgi:hypothetical protein